MTIMKWFRYEVTLVSSGFGMKWLVWSDFGMKWLIWSDSWTTLSMKWYRYEVVIGWSEHIFSLWYEVTPKMKWTWYEVSGSHHMMYLNCYMPGWRGLSYCCVEQFDCVDYWLYRRWSCTTCLACPGPLWWKWPAWAMCEIERHNETKTLSSISPRMQ